MELSEANRLIEEQKSRIQALEEEHTELLRRLEVGEVIHTLGLAANRSLDPNEVLGLVARVTRTALGASYVTVSTYESGNVRTLASIGLEQEPIETDPLAALVIEAGKPVRVDENGSHRPESFPAHQAEGMRAGLGVPLSLYGQTFGALVIGHRRGAEVGPRETRLAVMLAGHAAVAISNAQLHDALRDRSAELERAYKSLRESADAKERFFASLSHEIRTPINAILGYHSLIVDGIAGDVPPMAREFLTNAHRAAQGLLHLVNDVLDLSKIEAGKLVLEFQEISPADVVRDAMSTVRPLADQKNLALQFDEASSDAVLTTDRESVRQILVNLLSNAVKFTENGRIIIALTDPTHSPGRRADDAFVQIRVSDTGPGIEPSEHERIFLEFEQIRGASARGGTGLGLPISRKLARRLGGDLRVESEPGRGSSFVLLLPRQAPAQQGTIVAADTAETRS